MLSDKTKQYIKDYTKRCSNELGSVESKYGKRVISYREWLDPENAVSACEIEKEETVKDVCELLESEIERWSKGNDSCEAKYRIEMIKELIEKIKELEEL